MTDEKYLIYKLKHKIIKADIPERLGGYNLHGFVSNIERDVINHKIHMVIDGHEYVFKEPRVIKDDNEKIIFTYGDIMAHQLEDSELFNQIRDGSYVDEILRKNVADDVYCVSFNILPGDAPVIEKTKCKKAKKNAKRRKPGRKKGRRAK